jgi:hypothetical protein
VALTLNDSPACSRICDSLSLSFQDNEAAFHIFDQDQPSQGGHKKKFRAPANIFVIIAKNFLLCVCHQPLSLCRCENEDGDKA